MINKNKIYKFKISLVYKNKQKNLQKEKCIKKKINVLYFNLIL